MPKDTKEIEYKKEKRLGWIAFSILTFHFTLIIFSILPQVDTTNGISVFSKAYANTIFRQKWSMFAPCPVLENRINIKYYFEKDTTKWLDPSISVLKEHKKFRFTYHGNIAVGYYNMLYWLKKDLDELQIKPNVPHEISTLSDLKKSLGVRLLHNYVHGYAHDSYNTLPIKADLKITYRNVKTDSVTTYLFKNF